jgi:Protein of unknown function (DUF1353)
MPTIKYRNLKPYKYQVANDYTIDLLQECEMDMGNTPADISGFISLSADSKLTIAKGYSWDGPSGPTIDTKNFMRASLVHDALYQLMRANKLDRNKKDNADRILQTICKADGMSSIRAYNAYLGVKLFGASATQPREQEPQEIIYEAP